MGQQQLLLIVLGVIIVGIAVVVGINVFTASSLEANRDALVSDLTNIAANAQQYYRKPTALGGGGNDFTGYQIPDALQNTPNMDPDTDVDLTNPGGDGPLVLTATGTEEDSEGDKITVTIRVTPNEILFGDGT